MTPSFGLNVQDVCAELSDSESVMVLKGYFDDSSDDKRQRFCSIGGLIGSPQQWSRFQLRWAVATHDLPVAFHATDCEAQRGCCEGWTVKRTSSLMKTLTDIILSCGFGSYGAIIPVQEYLAVFPNSGKHDPYLLAFKQMLINMAYICRLAHLQGEDDTVTIIHEDGDTSPAAFQIYHDLKVLDGYADSKYLVGFSVSDKSLNALQGADLIAREAFKHADNLGIRKLRKPVDRLKSRTSFHLWTRESLEYLKCKGGPDNLGIPAFEWL